jgi:hypothetical protein
MAGLDPAIPLMEAQCSPKRDHRDKPGDDSKRALRQARIIVQITKQARPAIKARAGADMRAPSVRSRRIGREGEESLSDARDCILES